MKTLNPPVIHSLSAKDLTAALAAASAIRSGLCDELIAAGRGHETHSETMKKDDALSLRYVEASESYACLAQEKRDRQQWHGTLNPIRRQS